MRPMTALAVAFVLVGVLPALAKTVFVPAENKVPVAAVDVTLGKDQTVVRLQVQAAITKVCWNAKGDNSPYLLAGGKRYRFLDGDHIALCPGTQDYAAKEEMVLRFEPVDPKVDEVSLVEGKGGENQMIDPASSKARYWNFLHIKVR